MTNEKQQNLSEQEFNNMYFGIFGVKPDFSLLEKFQVYKQIENSVWKQLENKLNNK